MIPFDAAALIPFEHDLEHDLEPVGYLEATRHDFDDHRQCDPDACPNAEQATP